MIGIQARSTSTRFPNKGVAVVKGRTITEMVLSSAERAATYINRNTSKKTLLTTVVLLVPRGDRLYDKHKNSVRVFEGSENNVLERYKLMADKHFADYIVRLTGDCPIIPSHIISTLIRKCVDDELDYIANVDIETRTSVDGHDCEVFTKAMLEWAYMNARGPQDFEHVTLQMREAPPIWAQIGSVIGFIDQSDKKLSVDNESDLKAVDDELTKIETCIARAKARGHKVYRF